MTPPRFRGNTIQHKHGWIKEYFGVETSEYMDMKTNETVKWNKQKNNQEKK